MTNLLPQKEQGIIQKEYKNRRMIVAFTTLLFTVLVGTGFLVPSLLLSNVKLKEVSSIADTARKENEAQTANNSASVILRDADSKLALLKAEAVDYSAHDIFGLVVKDKSADIRIKEMTYVRSTTAIEGSIVVTGLAKNRESLTKFLHQMQAQTIFKSVDLPVSNFAKDKDIAFSMNISGQF